MVRKAYGRDPQYSLYFTHNDSITKMSGEAQCSTKTEIRFQANNTNENFRVHDRKELFCSLFAVYLLPLAIVTHIKSKRSLPD